MPVSMMMEQIAAYPVEDRVKMVDGIIASLNGIDPQIEAEWVSTARHRQSEFRSGKVRGISATTVFSRARRSCR